MPIIAKGSERVKHELSPGNYQAVCYGVWDIGMQKTPFKHESGEPVVNHQVVLAFEVNETISSTDKYSGKRFVQSKFYTLSLDERASLYKDLVSWRGRAFTPDELKGFDLENLIGANCFLNVVKSEKGYTKITSITPLPKGMVKIAPENKRDMPEFIKKKVVAPSKSVVEEVSDFEYGETSGQGLVDEDVPF